MVETNYQSGQLDGLKKGIEKGKAEGEKIGVEKGKAEGEKIGVEKGKIEGEKLGIEKGKTEEKLEIAKKMKSAGMTAALIREVTGVEADQLQ